MSSRESGDVSNVPMSSYYWTVVKCIIILTHELLSELLSVLQGISGAALSLDRKEICQP